MSPRLPLWLFLTLVSTVAISIGSLALFAPLTLLVEVKHAVPNDAAVVMARTVGVLLISVGLLNFSLRTHVDSPTMRVVLKANAALQLLILPIDPMAYANGTYATLGSFVPNTILHLILAAGFVYFASRPTGLTPSTAD